MYSNEPDEGGALNFPDRATLTLTLTPTLTLILTLTLNTLTG